jgi:hypothetical protein
MAGRQREKRFNLAGWLLFVVCAGFFIASAVISGDVLYLIGGIIFLLACIVFIIPLVTGGDQNDD